MDEEPLIDLEDLLPCPFCGGEAGITMEAEGNNDPRWFVECSDCEATCSSVELWQTRIKAA